MKIIMVLTLFISTSLFADTACRWENREDQPFETRANTWGGGEFKNFEECQRVVRITIMALEDYFKDFEGELTYTDPATGESQSCYLMRLTSPWNEAPQGFHELVYEAFKGRSSPQDFVKYADYIDSHFNNYCP